MTKEDLIPLTSRPKEEADAIRMRGGLARGQGKRRGQLIRWQKKKSPFFAFLMSIADTDDPKKAMDYYLANFDALEENIIRSEKEGKDTFYKRERLMQRYSEFVKFKFGEKHKNLNININTTTDEVIKRLKEAKKEFEDDISN